MKILVKLTILLGAFFYGAINTNAQFSVGIKDSRYVYGSYTFFNGVDCKIEHSLYSEKIGFQRIGLQIGYEKTLSYGFNWSANLLGATTWNGNYQVVSSEVSLKYNYRLLGAEATINPRYDSGLHYTTCWQIGLKHKIIEPIDVKLQYTTIPEFRMSEKRLRGGFIFKVDNLKVIPELSVSMQKKTRFKNMRVLMSMNYEF